MTKLRGLLAESEPTEGVVEAAAPVQARPATRAVPPDIARVAVATEGTLHRCHHIHRILAECVVQSWILFTDSVDFARIRGLERSILTPNGGLIPVAVTLRIVQEDNILLDCLLGNRLVLVTDLRLPDVVVHRRVRTSEVNGFLPVAVLLYADTAEDVDTGTNGCRQLGEFGNAFIAEWGVRRPCERVKETGKGSVVEGFLKQSTSNFLIVCYLAESFSLRNCYGCYGIFHSVT